MSYFDCTIGSKLIEGISRLPFTQIKVSLQSQNCHVIRKRPLIWTVVQQKNMLWLLCDGIYLLTYSSPCADPEKIGSRGCPDTLWVQLLLEGVVRISIFYVSIATCDFPEGVQTPCPPIWIRPCSREDHVFIYIIKLSYHCIAMCYTMYRSLVKLTMIRISWGVAR